MPCLEWVISEKNPKKGSRRRLEDIFEKKNPGIFRFVSLPFGKKEFTPGNLQNCDSCTLSAWKCSGQKPRPIPGKRTRQ